GVLSALAVRGVLATAPRWGRAAATAAPVLLGLGAGTALLRTDALVAASWFGATGRTWWTDALADQHRAGAAVLAVVGITAAALVVTAVMSVRSRRSPAVPVPRSWPDAAGARTGPPPGTGLIRALNG